MAATRTPAWGTTALGRLNQTISFGGISDSPCERHWPSTTYNLSSISLGHRDHSGNWSSMESFEHRAYTAYSQASESFSISAMTSLPNGMRTSHSISATLTAGLLRRRRGVTTIPAPIATGQWDSGDKLVHRLLRPQCDSMLLWFVRHGVGPYGQRNHHHGWLCGV